MFTVEEIKKLSEKDLLEEIRKSKFELLKTRLGISSRQSKETSKLKELRKYIARIKTFKRMLKIEQAPENPKSDVIK
ncbi:MAG: 50S ribosomal protein L29 [Candidatus Gracilibacteria bacterium]